MCLNAKFSLTSFSLTSFISWCEQINKFSLTSFHCSQQYNYTADEIKKQPRGTKFRFFIVAHAYLTREKRLLACGLGSTSFPGSLFSASIVVALVDKHFPTRVVLSLYFESATGRKSIRVTRHLIFILQCKYQKGQKSGCFIPTGNEFP